MRRIDPQTTTFLELDRAGATAVRRFWFAWLIFLLVLLAVLTVVVLIAAIAADPSSIPRAG